MPRPAPRAVRKKVFGRDPEKYDRVRPRYPERIYEVLTRRCGLGPRSAVFEIGPGTGIATRELLRRKVGALTLIEPDRRMARYLRATLDPRGSRVTIRNVPFERVSLPPAAYDLGIAATSFHWLPERRALRKVVRVLRPGGWWAVWNSQTSEPSRPDRFRRAIQPLYVRLSPRGRPYDPARERARARAERRARLRALRSAGRFDHVSLEEVRWPWTIDTEQAVALWGTFSEIATLSPRARATFLAGLRREVDERFGGRVTLPMTSWLYTARRALSRSSPTWRARNRASIVRPDARRTR